MVDIVGWILVIVLAFVTLAVINFIGKLLCIGIMYIYCKRDLNKYYRKIEVHKPSSYREAFMLECTEDMIQVDPYAKSLDKAIKIIDKKETQLEIKRRKIADKLSNMRHSEDKGL